MEYRSIKQIQDDILPCHWQRHGIIVKDRWNVVPWKFILGVRNQEARLKCQVYFDPFTFPTAPSPTTTALTVEVAEGAGMLC